MIVIKDNYSKFPIMALCAHCGSQIELESWEDLTIDGCLLDFYWRCPCCGCLNLIEIKL